MWEYDKLFAEGNTIGYLDSFELESKVHTHTIDYTFNKSCNMVKSFSNDQLAYSYLSDFIGYKTYHVERCIQYIIRLDEHGNVVEKLFDRERDMNPLPELKDGYFIEVKGRLNQSLGIVLGDYVTYQNGNFDEIADIEDKITKVWSNKILGFCQCSTHLPIWERNK